VKNSQKQRKKDFPMLPFVLLAKSGKLIKMFKMVKLLKFSKILITFFSMTLSVFVYAFMMGPWFSVGFVLMLFIHEMGHVAAMRLKGYPASAPVFIPMLGAVIFAPKFKNSDEEAYIGYGGPFVGGIAALALFALWAILPVQYPLLLMLSYSAAFLNLFNLLPIRPLDGGRVTHIVGGWFKWFGVAGLVWLAVVIKEPMMLLIFILILGDFNIKPKYRFYLGFISLITMATLMVLGYGKQASWIDITDTCIAALLVYFYYRGMKKTGLVEEKETNEPATLVLRLKWLGLYLLLVAGLILLMSIQAQYLPQQVR